MKSTFNLSEFRTVSADLDSTISIEVVDTRVPDVSLKAKGLSLLQFNERVDFLREHDHLFGMNMAKQMYCM